MGIRGEVKEVIVELGKLLEDTSFEVNYISLCREFPMNRIFVQGDWYVIFERMENNGLVDRLLGTEIPAYAIKGPKCWGPFRHAHRTLTTDRAEIVWLPRLDQLLAMLENWDYGTGMAFQQIVWPKWSFGEISAFFDQTPYDPTEGSSREEAAYKMLLRLTDKTSR